ncbi:DUF4130 domain-containing protein [Paraburkholderia graminis]|uniref:DNA metabolism protein n=1 Tax=Paraburkholderia graminis TaxID=60548 RepID=A0ABD5CKQ6_9BURK|nr:DUF4130 domain-containing protein [Paraburkholderia graminis]MDQ0624636.1 putative DNA metabolism protein [Paraburkholderia graminis]MDR6205794.1 putative DNA metabolism protein [Paraburkholderia graminis]
MNRISIYPSFSAWRDAARLLLRHGVEPERIEWIECPETAQEPASTIGCNGAGAALNQPLADAWGGSGASGASDASDASDMLQAAPASDTSHPSHASATPDAANGLAATTAVPRELLAWLKAAACFRAPDRWALLYRVLWRWTRGERDVLDLGDSDGALLDQRVRAVEHETEDMLNLTLFRRRDPSMGPPEFVGWYEPHHDLLEYAAERFAARMGYSTWMLATPRGAALWNGMLLRISQPVSEHSVDVPAEDAMTGEAVTSESTEALWLGYYEEAVSDETPPVPLRYWRAPPEGPPLPARLARERVCPRGQNAVVTVPASPLAEYSALTPPLREPTGPLDTCRRCALWRNAKQPVPGAGAGAGAGGSVSANADAHTNSTAPASPPIMVVGEQPGEYENQHGVPFTGPAGQLLDSVVARAGLERAALYLTYAVKHYKWEIVGRERIHRTPAQREVEACQYWLDKELAQLAPRVVVALGPTALRALTGAHVNLSEYAGRTISHGGRIIVPTWHPAYALRTADPRLRDDIVARIATAFRWAAELAGRRVRASVTTA